MKIFILLLFICLYSSVWAQTNEKYHVFGFENKSGVTDTLGKEVLPAKYDWEPEILYFENKLKKWIFRNEQETVIFNVADGKIEKADQVIPYFNYYKDTMYMLVEASGNRYMQNHGSNTEYKLPKNRNKFYDAVEFIYVKEDVSKVPESTKNTIQNKYTFYNNPSSTNPIFSIVAQQIMCLKKYERNPNAKTKVDYIAFLVEDTVHIYDNKLKFIKSVAKPEVKHFYMSKTVSEAMGIDLVDNNVTDLNSGNLELKYLDLMIMYNRVYLRHGIDNSKKQFLFASQYKVDHKGTYIVLKQDNDNIAKFDINPSNGKLFIPKKYLDQLNLDFSSGK